MEEGRRKQDSRNLAFIESDGRSTASSVQFTDVTSAVHLDFKHESSATSNKYLIETMGGGVALLDYDNDGRLDIFFTNGAKVDDPMPDGKAGR